MKNFDHFNFLAPIYDRAIKVNNLELLKKFVALPSPGNLLDAGGGTGRIGEALKPYIDTVIIADLSLGMLKKAYAKNGLLTVCAATERLPFPEASFDRIVIVDAIHHVYDARKTCSELWRLIKPGGRILIEEPDIRTLPVKIVSLVEKLALMRSFFVSPPQIAAYFEPVESKIRIQQVGYTSWIMVDKIKKDS
jgi:demethylmenaquinone methyltransferase/2-methoxy-6-polyprenyl-1,4-benzoquinol methylase